MAGKGKKQVGSREVKRMKARTNPRKKGGRERKQPIERKNGGERKRKRGGKLGRRKKG
jgi:hypothetical protein